MNERELKEQLRKLEERVRKLEGGARAPQRSPKGGGSGGGATRKVKVKENGNKDNYLECQFWDENSDTLGADVNVLKPYYFRVATYKDQTINGIAYEHLSTNATGAQQRRAVYLPPLTETEEIFPAYYEDAVLDVARLKKAISVQVDQSSEEDEPETVSCTYVDINTEPRAWGAR